MEADEPSARVLDNPPEAYYPGMRYWQGIPGIEITAGGRYYAAWYSGARGETPGNYVVLATRADNEAVWTDPQLIIAPPTPEYREYDPCLWRDPLDRLWLFWAQSRGAQHDGRAGVWSIRCDNPDEPAPTWSKPRRLANGVMMNKPLALADGAWLMPAAVWAYSPPYLESMSQERFSNVFRSTDQGETWQRIGGADVPDRQFDEHMVVELKDARLWMLVRTRTGIGGAFSSDGGRQWSNMTRQSFSGPGSRFFLRRLSSGELLLVNHVDFTGRNNLAALLSDDEGRNWHCRLMLDTRNDVSYPDGVEDAKGNIHLIYDRERHHAREILAATITVEDIRAGKLINPQSRLRQLVSRATGKA